MGIVYPEWSIETETGRWKLYEVNIVWKFGIRTPELEDIYITYTFIHPVTREKRIVTVEDAPIEYRDYLEALERTIKKRTWNILWEASRVEEEIRKEREISRM